MLNERQAGAAIEGVVREERIETSQLAADTLGYTDFAMALARLLGFDLCPGLKELKQPPPVCAPRHGNSGGNRGCMHGRVDTALIESHSDALVHT